MLKDLFNNRLFIGALAFFVLMVVGGTFYIWHVERQEAAKLAETQAHIKQWNEKQKSPEPTTVEAPVVDTSQGGHFHADGTFHAGPHDALIPKTSAQLPMASSGERVLTKEQEAEWQKYWADMGLEPPPSGYGYQWDENGKVSLFQYNVPEFEIKWSEKETPGQDYYKLTDEEWRRHRALRHIISQTPLRLTQEHEKMLREGKPFPTVTYAPGVVELAKQRLAELDRKASGRTPKVSTTVSWNREPTKKELEEIERKEFEMLKSLEKPRRPSPGPWDEAFIDATLKELEAGAQRR